MLFNKYENNKKEYYPKEKRMKKISDKLQQVKNKNEYVNISSPRFKKNHTNPSKVNTHTYLGMLTKTKQNYTVQVVTYQFYHHFICEFY